MKFIDNGDGTATISGRPGNGQGLIGDYALTLTASNGMNPPATQNFTLTISNPPRIVSANNTTFVVGTSNTFTIKALKTVPKSTLSFTGALPAGVTFVANNNGTATLSGNPAAGSEGVYQITLTAQNGTLPNATQLFTLTVQDAVPIFRAPTHHECVEHNLYRWHRRHFYGPNFSLADRNAQLSRGRCRNG